MSLAFFGRLPHGTFFVVVLAPILQFFLRLRKAHDLMRHTFCSEAAVKRTSMHGARLYPERRHEGHSTSCQNFASDENELMAVSSAAAISPGFVKGEHHYEVVAGAFRAAPVPFHSILNLRFALFQSCF